MRHDGPLRLAKLIGGDELSRVPEPPVVERRGGQAHPAVVSGAVPPIGETRLGARVDDPVGHRQSDVGAHRRRCITSAGSDHLVDNLCHTHPLEHRPHRRQVPEGQVPAAVRLARPGALQAGDDLLGRAQVALGNDPGLAAHPGRLDQVVVRLAALPLPHDRCHI